MEKRKRAESALSKGVDFSSGAVLLSRPTPYPSAKDDTNTGVGSEDIDGAMESELGTEPLWRRWTFAALQRAGVFVRVQEIVRQASLDCLPMPKIWSVAGKNRIQSHIAVCSFRG